MGGADANGHRYPIYRGPCSDDTEAKLRSQECINAVFGTKAAVFPTIRRLVRSICRTSVWRAFKPGRRSKRVNDGNWNITETEKEHIISTYKSETINDGDWNITEIPIEYDITIPQGEIVFDGNWNITAETDDGFNTTNLQRTNVTKIIPISEINEEYEPTLARVPQLENTKHRYPWICSLRGIKDKKHFCGVTLLAVPPSPTVIVGAAHCTFVCKSPHSESILPNCCCANVGREICADNTECEEDAETMDLTGNEAEILCGEWETGTVAPEDSGEVYNIILPIIKIVKHPDYHISRGEVNSQYVADDVAVFMVNDKELQDTTHEVNPACLPKKKIQPTLGIHSGWSHPPPLKFQEENLPHYVPYYQDLHKQWHHNMSVAKCRDPDEDIISMKPLKYPTNSYYPPGTIVLEMCLMNFVPHLENLGLL